MARYWIDTAMGQDEKMKPCPVCDESGQMPDAMRGVIYKPDVSGNVPCWVCHGEGSIPQDREVSPLWTLHKAAVE